MRKSLNEYKLIITDMDGTLYFHTPVRVCMVLEMLCHFWRIPEFFIISRYRKLAELGLNEKERFMRLPHYAPSIIDEWMQKRPLKYIRLFRDKWIIEKLNSLHKKGTKVVVYSDYPVKKKAEAVGLAADYMMYAGDEEIQCMKPDPHGILNILHFTGMASEDVLFLGDRYEKDGICAELAKIDYLILSSTQCARKKFDYSEVDYDD